MQQWHNGNSTVHGKQAGDGIIPSQHLLSLFFLNFYLRLGFGSCLVHTKTLSAHKSRKEFCMYRVLNKVYLQNFFRDGYNFSRRI